MFTTVNNDYNTLTKPITILKAVREIMTFQCGAVIMATDC